MNPILRALTTGLIDYAGLFPPAQLPMADVVRRYGSFRGSRNAWMLGRLIVPAARFAEFCAVCEAVGGTAGHDPWELSVLLGGKISCELARMQELLGAWPQPPAPRVRSVELRWDVQCPPAELRKLLPADAAVYVELPPDAALAERLAQLAAAGCYAKIRLGGLTSAAFPSSAVVAEFLDLCAAQGLAFKATAGLHHPLRGPYPITLEEGSPCAAMHGFLNIFLAATARWRYGLPREQLVELLDETQPAAFEWQPTGVRWRELELSRDDVVAARTAFGHAFGSCSLDEPREGLAHVE